MDVINLTISSGRLLSSIDLENNSKVCLLGNDIASTLFGLSNPVGQDIKIDGISKFDDFHSSALG